MLPTRGQSCAPAINRPAATVIEVNDHHHGSVRLHHGCAIHWSYFLKRTGSSYSATRPPAVLPKRRT